jgi:hypothetical protein
MKMEKERSGGLRGSEENGPSGRWSGPSAGLLFSFLLFLYFSFHFKSNSNFESKLVPNLFSNNIVKSKISIFGNVVIYILFISPLSPPYS